MTMIELTIYMFLFTLATGVVIALFNTTRTMSQNTTASYLVNGNTDTAIRWLRQDLKETALTSLRVTTTPQPGASMVSARSIAPGTRGKLLVNKHGAPQWEKHVFYTLEPTGGKTGNLIRWERELDLKNLLPSPSSIAPNAIEGNVRRVVLGGVVVPGAKLEGAGSHANVTAGAAGGFRVQFIRRAGGDDGTETKTNDNPKVGSPADNTRLVETELQIYRENGSRPDYYAITFRVAPTY